MMRKYHVRFGGGLSQKYRLRRRQLGGSLPYPGADYEAILSELAKYGASLILATQSLARLEALDRDQGRSLRATVFANLDGLFAFHTSAEDARYLVRELGGEIDEHDLVELGEHQCYAKLSAGGERLPTFSVSLDPPPNSDAGVRNHLAEASAARYGRDTAAIDGDLQSAQARIESLRASILERGRERESGSADDPARAADDPGSTTKQPKARNQNRSNQKQRGAPLEATRPEPLREAPASEGSTMVQGELNIESRGDEVGESET